MARSFRLAGWSVELICGIARNEEVSANVVEGASIFPIELTVKSGPMKFLEYHRKLSQRVLSLGGVDAILSCDLYSLGAAVRAKSRGKASWVVYDSREVYTELPSTANRPLVKLLWKMFEHRGLANADSIWVTGPLDLDAIFRLHGFTPRSTLIRNLPEKSETLYPRQDLRSKLHIDKQTPLFVYVGGLQIGRGLDPFLRAFAESAADAHFIVVGDGDQRQKLESLVRELNLQSRVTFLGAIIVEDVLPILVASDIGVTLIESLSLSYAYALPSKLFEYMMAGLVVISSPLEQVTDLFNEESWLVTAKPSSREEMRAAIQNAIEKSSHIEMRERARKLALETYNFESEFAPVIKLLNNEVRSH
jgi:glycosyltransferase involved in cell wall biosynthesis